jgi:hypothetical protein
MINLMAPFFATKKHTPGDLLQDTHNDLNSLTYTVTPTSCLHSEQVPPVLGFDPVLVLNIRLTIVYSMNINIRQSKK